MTKTSCITPAPLKPGDTIAIITPSTYCDSSKIDSALVALPQWGYNTVIMPYTYGREFGSYTAEPQKRAQSIIDALKDPSIKAIMCSRGGYGANHLLPLIDPKYIQENPKWMIGFSDISILCALWLHSGVVSIHGPMTGHIRDEAPTDPALGYLKELLATGKMPVYSETEGHEFNHPGKGEGTLMGGNFIVINNLAQTPWDELIRAKDEDVILFIEDVGEKIYAIERMLVRLQQAGILPSLKGLILGQFTETEGDLNFPDMNHMFYHNLKYWGYYNQGTKMPIVFNFPVGHVTKNYPLPVGAKVSLEVKKDGSYTLKQVD